MVKERLDPRILAMYIGSECMADGNRFTLKGVFIGESGTEAFTGNGREAWWVENCDFKLLLRKISEITEAEKKELWRLIFSQGHGKDFTDRFKDFQGSTRVITEKTYYDVPRNVMMQGVERLAIESDGNIWADCDLHNWRHNRHTVTAWLLSKGFDLFGLIEAGHATILPK